MSLDARALRHAVNGRVLLDDATLAIRPGRLHVLLGPNGAGKSTLLRLMAGEMAPQAGAIGIDGLALGTLTPGELARRRAVLPQSHGLAFGFSAAQVVALGRLPCPRHDAGTEARIVGEALELAGVGKLADRSYTTLSGGERARVQFARVMAQVWEPLSKDAPRYLLLDEPTASLDLAHQHDCLRALRTLAGRGIGVLVVLHDPNLALRYGDDVTLLAAGRVAASGTPSTVITAAVLESMYHVPVRLVQAPGELFPLVVVSEAGRAPSAP